MIRTKEVESPTSCLNKAADDEPIFVLRAKDPLAPIAVRYWASLAGEGGLHEPEKVTEAFFLAADMKEWRQKSGGARQ